MITFDSIKRQKNPKAMKLYWRTSTRETYAVMDTDTKEVELYQKFSPGVIDAETVRYYHSFKNIWGFLDTDAYELGQFLKDCDITRRHTPATTVDEELDNEAHASFFRASVYEPVQTYFHTI